MAEKSRRRPKLQARRTPEPGVSLQACQRFLVGWIRDVVSNPFGPRRPGRKQAQPAAAVPVVKPTPIDKWLPRHLMNQFDELVPRLVSHESAQGAVRHLLAVYKKLRVGGWPEVERLHAKAISRAIAEAELVASEEPSAVLDAVVERLRLLQVAAKERARLEAKAQCEAFDREWERQKPPEVSDTNFDEYELMERSWAGTVPSGLVIPARVE